MSVPTGNSRTADLPVWARWQSAALLLQLHVQPGARHTAVVGVHGQRLKIALHAPPVDGKANAELLRFLATLLSVRRAAVRLAAGTASREKSVAIDCAGADAQRLAGLLAGAAPPEQ
jgi:uncharacterized protein (TIGR00251 family)